MNGHQEQDEVDGGKLGRILFQKGRHKSGDNVDSPVTKRIRNGSGPPKNGSPSSKRNSTGEKYLYFRLRALMNYVTLVKLVKLVYRGPLIKPFYIPEKYLWCTPILFYKDGQSSISAKQHCFTKKVKVLKN